MQNLTINKTDLRNQLAAELAEIRDGDLNVTASALVFTRDDRYSLAVRVTGARSGYNVNVRTFIGGEAADGNTTLINTIETTCANVAEIIEFATACAGCADLDAENAAPAEEKAETHATIRRVARKAAEDLIVYASDLDCKRQGLRSARACVDEVRREIDFHLVTTDARANNVRAAVMGIRGRTPWQYSAAMRVAADVLQGIAGDEDAAAKVDAAPADREFYVATISGTDAERIVVDTVRAESEEAAALDVAARVYGGAFFDWMNDRRDMRGGVVVLWMTHRDRDAYAPITVHAVDPELAAPTAPVRTDLVNAMCDHDRPLRMTPAELLATADRVRNQRREFYVATLSGTTADPIVVETVAAASMDAAADQTARRIYGDALAYQHRRRISYVHGADLVWYCSAGGSPVPVVVAPTDRPFDVDARVSAVMRRDGMTQRHVSVEACLQWAQLKRGEIAATVDADGLHPWTVIGMYQDNGHTWGDHVQARDGSHALALVAADRPGADLVCAVAGSLTVPDLVYAGDGVVGADQYSENHGADA